MYTDKNVFYAKVFDEITASSEDIFDLIAVIHKSGVISIQDGSPKN